MKGYLYDDDEMIGRDTARPAHLPPLSVEEAGKLFAAECARTEGVPASIKNLQPKIES